MACFTAFIEQTIAAANITDVYDIKSTGQLIPFIIGLVSCASTIAEICRTFWLERWTVSIATTVSVYIADR